MILTGISILLNAYKDLEKELTHLFNEVFLFLRLKKAQSMRL